MRLQLRLRRRLPLQLRLGHSADMPRDRCLAQTAADGADRAARGARLALGPVVIICEVGIPNGHPTFLDPLPACANRRPMNLRLSS